MKALIDESRSVIYLMLAYTSNDAKISPSPNKHSVIISFTYLSSTT